MVGCFQQNIGHSGSDIEGVGDFNYLGAVFHYTGNLMLTKNI